MKCKYCGRDFKNKHGLHIHWFYCRVKTYKEMEKKYVDNKKYEELMGDEKLLPIQTYPNVFIAFIEKGEFGIIFNVRYILK